MQKNSVLFLEKVDFESQIGSPHVLNVNITATGVRHMSQVDMFLGLNEL